MEIKNKTVLPSREDEEGQHQALKAAPVPSFSTQNVRATAEMSMVMLQSAKSKTAIDY